MVIFKAGVAITLIGMSFLAIAQTITGNSTGPDSKGVVGISTGERTVGVLGQGESSGVRGEGQKWNGVEGISQSTIGGAGVYGVSETGAGVRGESKAKWNSAVHGIHRGQGEGVYGEAVNGTGTVGKSTTWHGVYGETQSTIGGVGVYGTTDSAQSAGGEFHNKGGGDLIRAGKDTVFRVSNNGDVFVRGQRIGATGPQGIPGPQGPQGLRGPPGPVSRAGCMCSWEATNYTTNLCTNPGGSGRATGGIAECVSAAQQASAGACNIRCPDL